MDYVEPARMAAGDAQGSAHACLGEDTLAAFADGQLGPRDAARVEDHLARCEACGKLVDHGMSTRGALTSVERSRSEAPEADAPLLEPGTQVGRYVVLEQVGAGAMSTVYAAHDPELDRRVALKLLRAGGKGHDPRARLYREAKAMARLAHPNVITVYDVGPHGAQLFVAMELVTGGTLRGWLGRAPRDWRAILAAFVQAGRGLACAHAAGLVHRDFKPDNVLVSDDGRVRVTDFGLARGSRDDEPVAPADGPLATDLVTTITRTGALVGTPAYMAPEQLRGEAIDARADMFGFCVALYEALYGERPFEGRNVHGLRTSTAAGVVRPTPHGSEVPARVRDAVLLGLRPRPDDRHASMDALLDALADAARIDEPAPPPVGVAPRSPRAARRWTFALVIAGAALSLGGGLVVLRGSGPALSADVVPAIERDTPPAPPRVVAVSPTTSAATEMQAPAPSVRAIAAPTGGRMPPRPSPVAAPASTAPGLASAALVPSPPTPVTVSSAVPPAAPRATPARASSLGTATYDRE